MEEGILASGYFCFDNLPNGQTGFKMRFDKFIKAVI